MRTGHLVGGHQRLKVLIARGDQTAEVSVVDLAPEREKALNLALNKVAGGWDQDKLAALLDELSALPNFDIAITGFDLPEIDAILAGAMGGDSRPESFDLDAELARGAAAGPPVTKPGDMVLLGRDPRVQHRLVCGDSTDAAVVRRLMEPHASTPVAKTSRHPCGMVLDGPRPSTKGPSLRAALFCTDPPYLVGYDGTNHPGSAKSKSRRSLNKNWSGTYCASPDGTTWDDPDVHPELYDKFVAVAIAEAVRPNAAFYCWHASKRQGLLDAAWAKHGVLMHQQIVWVKPRPVLNRSWYTWQHEPCLMGWLQGNKPTRVERAVLSTVWAVDGLERQDRPDHPTPKPLEIFEIPIRQHTQPGEICYEPFAGSGTQIIAAQRTGRRCFGIELSPVYCDLIVRRFIAYAGESAVDPATAARYRRNSMAAPKGSSARASAVSATAESNARSGKTSSESWWRMVPTTTMLTSGAPALSTAFSNNSRR